MVRSDFHHLTGHYHLTSATSGCSGTDRCSGWRAQNHCSCVGVAVQGRAMALTPIAALSTVKRRPPIGRQRHPTGRHRLRAPPELLSRLPSKTGGVYAEPGRAGRSPAKLLSLAIDREWMLSMVAGARPRRPAISRVEKPSAFKRNTRRSRGDSRWRT